MSPYPGVEIFAFLIRKSYLTIKDELSIIMLTHALYNCGNY